MDFSNKYIETYTDTCNAVADISMAINGDKQSDSRYRIIPLIKKGKNMQFNAVDFNTLNETLIFMSQKTIGVKLFSKNHTPISSYSVSRNNGTQIILITYPDGTSMEQKSLYNPESGSYVYSETICTILASDIINPDDYSDEIINQDLKVRLMYDINPDNRMIRLKIAFIDDANDSLYYMEEHPELLEISNLITENGFEYVQSHLNCLSLNDPEKYYHIIGDFYSSFKKMIKEIHNRQQNLDDSTNPNKPDDTSSPHSDDENR